MSKARKIPATQLKCSQGMLDSGKTGPERKLKRATFENAIGIVRKANVLPFALPLRSRRSVEIPIHYRGPRYRHDR